MLNRKSVYQAAILKIAAQRSELMTKETVIQEQIVVIAGKDADLSAAAAEKAQLQADLAAALADDAADADAVAAANAQLAVMQNSAQELQAVATAAEAGKLAAEAELANLSTANSELQAQIAAAEADDAVLIELAQAIDFSAQPEAETPAA